MEIIGEAAGRFTEEYKKNHDEVNWAEIVGMRNKLIHDYFDVDYSIVWKTLIDDLPKLEKILKE